MNTLMNNYYFKALDAFLYSHDEFMEAINYALSYDENNADAHYLLGRFYMEELKNFSKARVHFETALSNDLNHINTYYYFIRWSIDTGDYELGNRLIRYAKGILGISIDSLLHAEGLLFEKQGKLKKAQVKMIDALATCMITCDMNFYENELKRINSKLKNRKKKGK